VGTQPELFRDPGRRERGAALRDEVLSGVVDSVVFEREDGRFSIVRLEVEGRDEPVVAKGDLGRIAPGQPVKVTGRFVQDRKYGMQFQVAGVLPTMPQTSEGILKYLASAVPGVGEATAKKIVDKLGADALEKIEKDDDALFGLVGRKRRRAIRAHLKEKRVEAEILSALFAHGLGQRMARKIREKYGDKAAEVIHRQPYKLGVDIDGIGFLKADAIARTAGIGEDDPARAAAAAMHVLREAMGDGHVMLPATALAEAVGKVRVPAERTPDAIRALVETHHVVVEGDAVYLRRMHEAEVALARRIAGLAGVRAVDPTAFARADLAAKDLAARQQGAVRATLESGLVVLTGGPGTGKTTTLRAVVRLHESLKREVVLCAPTGRAAKRMAEATGRPAKTIHRLLEWSPTEGDFAKGEADPLDADLVVVDEASMLDVPLAEKLLAAVRPGATVLLVGDVDQLPPVGPGSVLRDVIASGAARTVRLTEVFRQAAESRVVLNAHRVNSGDLPAPGPKDGDFHVVLQKDAAKAADLVVKAVCESIPRAFGIPAGDVMVLSPMHKGPVGVAELNRRLQAALNSSERPEKAPPGMLRVNDRVMQLRNDYEHDVFNGDIGVVRGRGKGSVRVEFDGRDVTFEGDSQDDLTLAYASTIHKSQGSEFPAVVVVLHTGHHVMLARNLLYTAITRARKLVVLVAHPAALERAVKNARSAERFGRLRERIVAAVGTTGS